MKNEPIEYFNLIKQIINNDKQQELKEMINNRNNKWLSTWINII